MSDMGTKREKTNLLIGQLGLFTGRVADPAFELLFDLLKQAVHTVLEEVSVVSRLIAAQVSQGLQSEGFQLLFSVRVAASAHFLRNLGGTQDERVIGGLLLLLITTGLTRIEACFSERILIPDNCCLCTPPPPKKGVLFCVSWN